MNIRMKYLRLSAAVAAIFLILMLSEVRERLEDAAGMLAGLKVKRESLMSPDEILSKKRILLMERERLSAIKRQKSPGKDQNISGLFEYLTSKASERKIAIESFSPSGMSRESGMAQMDFVLNFTSDFHKAAAYINAVETGPYPVAVTGLSIQSDPPGNPALKVSISGRARFLPEGSAKRGK